MKKTEFKAVHTGEIFGYLASDVRDRLQIGKHALTNLIKEGFIVVTIVDLPSIEKEDIDG
jgi:hypothetical protein